MLRDLWLTRFRKDELGARACASAATRKGKGVTLAMGEIRSAGTLEGLRAILAETSQEELPQLIGALEVTKAEAQVRLISEAARPAPVEDEFLTVEEAAAALKRSESFVRGKCRKGHLKAMQDGRNWRIRRSALAAYERRRTK